MSSFSTVSITQVEHLILSIKSGSPSDPCPPSMFKQIHEPVAKCVANIFISMFLSGTFPPAWKKASILPLQKKSNLDPDIPSSYRPISRLSFPSKVMKKIMNSQLTQFMKEHNLLDPTQFSFRSDHSTETTLIKDTDKLKTILDEGGNAAFILLELSAAFDTVDHSPLCHRLET